MRRFTFCAGHRLVGHEGKCKNLCGHNYTLEAYLTGQEQDEIGRILDFKQLKLRMNRWIDDNWDHTFILWEKDENGLAVIRSSAPHRIYELKTNPTAENCGGAFSRGYLSRNSRGNRRARLQGPPLGKRRDVR
jgi:6-pyruvoyltetrahydropterin/6-carboxytetrahydropterin synthase